MIWRPHGVIARNHILNKGDKHGTVVRFPGWEGRAVVKNHFALIRLLNRLFECPVFLPKVNNFFLYFIKIWPSSKFQFFQYNSLRQFPGNFPPGRRIDLILAGFPVCNKYASSSKLDTNLSNRTNNTDNCPACPLKSVRGVRAVRVFLNLKFLTSPRNPLEKIF